jgi:hypothetical protein
MSILGGTNVVFYDTKALNIINKMTAANLKKYIFTCEGERLDDYNIIFSGGGGSLMDNSFGQLFTVPLLNIRSINIKSSTPLYDTLYIGNKIDDISNNINDNVYSNSNNEKYLKIDISGEKSYIKEFATEEEYILLGGDEDISTSLLYITSKNNVQLYENTRVRITILLTNSLPIVDICDLDVEN